MQHTRRENTGAHMLIRIKGGWACICLNQISYVSYCGQAIVFHLTSGKEITAMPVRGTFGQYTDRHLCDHRFIKPHAAYVVNLDQVQLLSDAHLELVSGERIPVSKRVYGNVKKQFVDYMAARREGVST